MKIGQIKMNRQTVLFLVVSIKIRNLKLHKKIQKVNQSKNILKIKKNYHLIKIKPATPKNIQNLRMIALLIILKPILIHHCTV